MVELYKPIKRKVRCSSTVLRHTHIVLVIYPHGEIGLREIRRRGEFKLSLAECWRIANQIAVNKQIKRVKELRKDGMALGEARRKARKEIVG